MDHGSFFFFFKVTAILQNSTESPITETQRANSTVFTVRVVLFVTIEQINMQFGGGPVLQAFLEKVIWHYGLTKKNAEKVFCS